MHRCMTGVVLFDRMFSIEVFFILCSGFSNTASCDTFRRISNRMLISKGVQWPEKSIPSIRSSMAQ